LEPAVERSVKDDAAARRECSAPDREWLFDPPELLSLGGIPGDELAFVAAGPALLRRVTADVGRAGDVGDFSSFEVHAEVVGRHIEHAGLRRESGWLLILAALEAGTDVLHILSLGRRL